MANYFPEINKLLKSQLGYALHPDHSDHFRAIINRAGLRRTKEAIRLTVLEHPENAKEAHTILEGFIWDLTPKKPVNLKYRNPQAEAAKQTMAAMDARVLDLVADPRQ